MRTKVDDFGVVQQRLEDLVDNRSIFEIVDETTVLPISPSGIRVLVGSDEEFEESDSIYRIRDQLRDNYGVDFTQKPDMLLVNPTNPEEVFFYYQTSVDQDIFVVVKVDERYGERESSMYVESKSMKEHWVELAEEKEGDLSDSLYKAELELMSFVEYMSKPSEFRLTRFRR